MNENELYHFGVKGMKWGVRRNRSSFVSTSGPKRLPGTYASDGNSWTAKAKRLPGAIVKKDGYDKSRTPKGAASLTSQKSGKSKQKVTANTPEAQAARKEKLKKAAKVGATIAGTALAAYGVYKVSKAISNKKQMKAAEAAVKKSLADKSALMNTVNAAKKNTNFSTANRGAWTSGKHSYVYDKASGTEGYVSTEYLNFLKNQRK